MKKTKHAFRLFTALTLTASALNFTGCASIVHSGDRTLTIHSDPSGADVQVRKLNEAALMYSGETPLTVSLDPKRGYFKGETYLVQLTLDGYAPYQLMIEPKLSGWYIGNIVFGGLIGMLVVDPLTGAMWNLAPEHI